MRYFAGIDGGGTSTKVAIATYDDQRARILGVGEAGPGNLHDVGRERLQTHVASAWNEAWHAAGIVPARCERAFFGMASVVTARDRATVEQIGVSLGLADRIDVDHDLRIALAAALGGSPGVIVIAGTGSSSYGRAADGTTWSAGGWGSFLDDRGSAFALGRGALVACAEAHDRRGPATSLSDRIFAELGLGEWRDLLARVDAEGMTRSEIAGLAPFVTEAATAGDKVSIAILESGVAELARCVETVAREIRDDAPRVSATGGLSRSGPVWFDRFRSAVLARVPTADVVEPMLDPVAGATLLAMQAEGLTIQPSWFENPTA